MSDNLESDIDRSLDHEERAVAALEAIGDALTVLAKLGSQVFDKVYPVKVPQDAVISRLPSEEDKVKADLGGSGDESLEEWTRLGDEGVGPRERAVVQKKKSPTH